MNGAEAAGDDDGVVKQDGMTTRLGATLGFSAVVGVSVGPGTLGGIGDSSRFFQRVPESCARYVKPPACACGVGLITCLISGFGLDMNGFGLDTGEGYTDVCVFRATASGGFLLLKAGSSACTCGFGCITGLINDPDLEMERAGFGERAESTMPVLVTEDFMFELRVSG